MTERQGSLAPYKVDLEAEFGVGSTDLVSDLLKRNMSLIRAEGLGPQNPDDLINLEIASQVLLGKPLLEAREKKGAVNSVVAYDFNPNYPFSIDYKVLLRNFDLYLLTGKSMLKNEASYRAAIKYTSEANYIRYELFDGDTRDIDPDFEGRVDDIRSLGLFYAYVANIVEDYPHINDEIISVLSQIVKDNQPMIRHAEPDEQISFLRTIADLILIQASSVDVSSKGAITLLK